MMRVLFIALAAFSWGAQAHTNFVAGKTISETQFHAIEEAYGLNSSAPYPIWRTGHTVCQAQTRCPNGQIAYCKTFASVSQQGLGASNGVCRWMVVPGRAVRCQGYALQRDFYGRSYYAYVDIPVACY